MEIAYKEILEGQAQTRMMKLKNTKATKQKRKKNAYMHPNKTPTYKTGYNI